MPDVFESLDYREFLKEWFDERKANNPRFSHRMFARLAGTKNPSLLLQVIQGKRHLTDATLAGFLKAMKLTSRQADFFRLLVQFDQARTTEERQEAWKRISATQRFQKARTVDRQGYRYLSHWSFPAIRELATLEGFNADPRWISRRLFPAITVAEARDGLEVLFDLGMLVEAPDGRVQATDASVVTAHQLLGIAVRNYHRQMISRAEACLDSVEADKRHFGAVTVGIRPELLPALKSEVAAFQERVLDLCDSTDDPDRVYQLNIQLFPLSRSILEDS